MFIIFLGVGILGFMSIYYGLQDGDVILTIIGFIFALPLVLVVFSLITGGPEKARKKQEEGKNRLDDKIRMQFEKEGIIISQEYRDVNYSVIGLDEENLKVCFLNSNTEVNPDLYEFLHDNITDNIQYSTSTFDYKDILETEVIIDGETVTKTSRSSQVGGAILGGILAGGVGAIIGGLSGKSSSKEKVKTIQFKIIVNDIKEPLQIITFLNESKSIDRINEKFIKANKEIMHWHSLFKVIIDIADKEDKKNQIQYNQHKSTFDTADEIRKLHELLKEDIITKEEFDLQKKKIIS